jgi:hypothetical protein
MNALNPRVIACAIAAILANHDEEHDGEVGIRLIASPSGTGYIIESTDEPAPEGWEVVSEDSLPHDAVEEEIVMSAYYLVEAAILSVKV